MDKLRPIIIIIIGIAILAVVGFVYQESPKQVQAQAGLVGHWKFDEGSGTIAADSSGNGNNGTLFNMDDNDWVSGKINGALDFDATDDYVELTNIPVNTTSGAKNTVVLWMYWNGADGKMPFGWDTSYDLWLSGGCFGFNTGQGNVFGFSSAGLVNKWIHVAAVFYNGVPSSTDNELYINGVKQSIAACKGDTTASRNVTPIAHISGWAYGLGYYFDGKIDDVRIYNRALIGSEILDLYNGGIGGGNVSQWAYSDTIGWISFSCTTDPNTDCGSESDYSVNVDLGTGDFSGYAWSDNIGWINFAPGPDFVTYPVNGYPASPYYSAHLESDYKVTGWVRAELCETAGNCTGWDGWIKLGDTTGKWSTTENTQVHINVDTVEFEGWAWGSDVIGWVSFNCKDRNTCGE